MNAVVNALRHIVRAIRLSSHVAEATVQISGAQLFVLQQLAEQPASSLREIADRTLTDQSSVSVVVRRLVARGLVARRTSARDGRRAELSLTEAGVALLRNAPELAHTRLIGALKDATPAELRSVAHVLDRVARRMGAGAEPPGMFFERGARSRAGGAARRPT